MNLLKSHFWYKKRQRNGIFLLLILLFSIQLFLRLDQKVDPDYIDSETFAHLEAKLDSLSKIEPQQALSQTYPFNPNFISDFKAYKIGLSVEEADRLFDFRAKGKFINSAQDFQKVTGINDSLLQVLSPLFKFPSWITKTNPKKTVEKKAPTALMDLNSATFEQLTKIEGLSLSLAKRIISYRQFLQQYSLNEQLYEVYHLNQSLADQVLQHFQVIRTPVIKKIDINTASFKQLLHLPYIDYELTKKLVQYRDENSFFENLEELKKIDSFPLEKFDRIALYLSAE